MESKVFLIIIPIFGVLLYVAIALTFILYALGSNESKKGRRVVAAAVGVLMLYALGHTIISNIKYLM